MTFIWTTFHSRLFLSRETEGQLKDFRVKSRSDTEIEIGSKEEGQWVDYNW